MVSLTLNGTCNSTLDDLRSTSRVLFSTQLSVPMLIQSSRIVRIADSWKLDLPPTRFDNCCCMRVNRHSPIAVSDVDACSPLHETLRAKTVRRSPRDRVHATTDNLPPEASLEFSLWFRSMPHPPFSPSGSTGTQFTSRSYQIATKRSPLRLSSPCSATTSPRICMNRNNTSVASSRRNGSCLSTG
jgi:hypothetical protein